ncbi:hypothetical protein BCF46_1968 [Litoreibacter meonggei]|uniref:Uncharacterized protein n=1 Tax=Litoreibacter meonggei TaxID=1049199 RepID=A0A497W716_9RHOB|nr:hypothetical protein [Litoreibacter meonggei]RLJ51752.1 hypothetical protein BCF46_1968 [Litoreibacter meonggei]
MSDLSISSTEHGKLRVFALSDQLSMKIDNAGTLDPLVQVLGSQTLGVQDVQIVPTDAVDDMGLSGLLLDGYEIALSSEEAARLDALEGTVALIRTGAFQTPVTLRRTGEANLIATLTEGKSPAPRFTPLESDAAKGVLEGPAADAKPARSFGARLSLIALAAMVSAFACLYIYYVGF